MSKDNRSEVKMVITKILSEDPRKGFTSKELVARLHTMGYECNTMSMGKIMLELTDAHYVNRKKRTKGLTLYEYYFNSLFNDKRGLHETKRKYVL